MRAQCETDHSWRYQPAGDKATAKLPFFSSDCECSDSWPKDPRCVYNQCPNFWNKAKVIKSLVRSDHLAVLLKPVVKVKATRKTVEFRDLREHNKLKMLRKMDDFQRDTITNGTTCPNEMINNFYNKIWPIFDECFPVVKTRVSSRDLACVAGGIRGHKRGSLKYRLPKN